MPTLQEMKDRRVKAISDKLKSENDAILQKVSRRARVLRARAPRKALLTPSLALERTQYAKLKKFVKDQKKRTAKVSKKHEWTQRKSRLHQDAEDAENEVLANCRLFADNKDAQFGEVFMETLSSYETQEGEIKVLSHKVNGIIIAFLSAKNYIFSMLDTIEPAAEGQQDPVQVFASDIRSTFMSVSEEVDALREEEEALDQYIKKYSPLHSDLAVYGTEGLPDCRGVLDDLLRKYVIAETHVCSPTRSKGLYRAVPRAL